jgi:pseudaminic acid biosynthesis-associated methylase
MSSKKETEQLSAWAGEWGNDYTDRNPQSLAQVEEDFLREHGLTRTAANEEFLGELPQDISILEVGANVGYQLEFLRRAGFSNSAGIEPNSHAIKRSLEINPKVRIEKGSGFELPFEDGQFDLVYTSGVLIHISPKDIKKIISEIYRVSKRYIWGFEYYAPEGYPEIPYHGKKNLLWKTDFAALYLKEFSDLKLVKDKKLPILGTADIDHMFLLKKGV